MSTPQEILQGMIDAAPEQAAKAQLSIDQIQVSIDDFQTKQDAMKTGVGDVATSRLETYLAGLYPPASGYHQYKGATYNQIESSSGTITDWKIYKLLTLSDITFISDVQFFCRGDKSSVFVENTDLGFTLSGGKVYSTVSVDSVYTPVDPMNPFPLSDFTTVDLSVAVLDATISEVWKLEYSYTPGDTTIDGIKSQWDFAHDYIVQPLGTSGSYGTQDNIAKLNLAKGMLQTNKAKTVNSITVFQDFV